MCNKCSKYTFKKVTGRKKNMDRVCCIIDMDGYELPDIENTSKRKFFVRELAYVRVSKEYIFLPKSYRFDLTNQFDSNVSSETMKTMQFQSRLTGLSVLPLESEPVFKYGDRFDLMRSIYARCKTSDLNLVAFKGGINEKIFLKTLQIPSLNLERYGCPGYEDLLRMNSPYFSVQNCGYHRQQKAVLHCPLAEVKVFRDWLKLRCRYFYRTDEDSESSDDYCSSEDTDERM